MHNVVPLRTKDTFLPEDDFEHLRCLAVRACGSLENPEITVLQNTLQGKPTELGDQDRSDRLVRPIFIRWIIGVMSTSPKIPAVGLRIKDALFEQNLNLAGVDFRSPLILERCTFEDGVDLRGATTGFIDFSESESTAPIRATGLTVHGDFRLRNNFNAKNGMIISNAKISGNLDCRGSHFGRIPDEEFVGADRRQYERSGPAIVADGIEIGGNLLCSRTISTYGSTDFEAEGGIELINADIKGTVDFTGAKIISDHIFARGF